MAEYFEELAVSPASERVSAALSRDDWDEIIGCVVSTEQNFAVGRAGSDRYWDLIGRIREQIDG